MPDNRVTQPKYILFKDSEQHSTHVGTSACSVAMAKLCGEPAIDRRGLTPALGKLRFGERLDVGSGVVVMRIEDSEPPVNDPEKLARSGPRKV